MLLSTAISVQIPLLTGEAINVLRQFTEVSNVELVKNRLLFLALGIVGLTVVVGVLSFIQGYANTYFSQKVVYDIRNDAFKSLQNQSFAFYGRTQTGQLLSKVTTDVDRIRFLLSHQLLLVASSVFMLAATLYVMLSINPRLTLFLVPIIPLMFFSSYLFAKKIRPLYGLMRQQYGSLTAVLHENVTGIRVVRAFAQEDYERKKFEHENDKYFQTNLTSAKIAAFYVPLTGLIVGLGVIVIFWYGGSLAITEPQTFTIGALITFTLYITMLVAPMRSISMFVSGYQLSIAAGERVFGIIDAEAEIKEKPDALKLPTLKGHVNFENVSFDYEKDRQILKNINLEAKSGETVALLGATGSGKSTIIRLIPRFYDVTSGKITIDGHDVRDVKLKSLRKQIGIVSQEAFLFTMTIKENIAYGKPGATMEEIVAAAKVARAHEFISKIPNGYDSRVGEKGVTLSAGQRQRIAIARALLVDPRILILDDSTSSVDVETEYEIQRALRALLKNRTAFVITQRVSTIRNADKIVVLENGEITEEGTHETLMAKKGAYYQIYQTLYEAQRSIIETKPKQTLSEQEDRR